MLSKMAVETWNGLDEAQRRTFVDVYSDCAEQGYCSYRSTDPPGYCRAIDSLVEKGLLSRYPGFSSLFICAELADELGSFIFEHNLDYNLGDIAAADARYQR